jgi:hypothetical protein
MTNREREPFVRFVPSRVDGLPNVSVSVVYPDRLELQSAGGWAVFRFDDIAEWPCPAWLWRLFARIGWRPSPLLVGERDWFHEPSERFFRFFTWPRLTIYMPDEPGIAYGSTVFRQIEEIIGRGGFNTWDLG